MFFSSRLHNNHNLSPLFGQQFSPMGDLLLFKIQGNIDEYIIYTVVTCGLCPICKWLPNELVLPTSKSCLSVWITESFSIYQQ